VIVEVIDNFLMTKLIIIF